MGFPLEMYSKVGLANWICSAKWVKLVGKWPMADCCFKLCCMNHGYSYMCQCYMLIHIQVLSVWVAMYVATGIMYKFETCCIVDGVKYYQFG